MTDPLYRPLLFSEGSGPVSHRTPLLHNVRLQYNRSRSPACGETFYQISDIGYSRYMD